VSGDSVDDALAILLDSLIDYAGLFPPAGLPMHEAVAHYDRYLRSEHSGALGRFILPVARLQEFVGAAESRSIDAPWRLSVLAGADLAAEARLIEKFNDEHRNRYLIDTVEVKASGGEQVRDFSRELPDELAVYFEIASDSDPRRAIEAVAESGRRAKIRTGGVTEDAFPAAARIVRFMSRCHESGVSFKGTAGLHHPIRCVRPLTYEADATRGTMHGFINLFLAAALVQRGEDGKAEALLGDDDITLFALADDSIVWRDESFDLEAIRKMRQFAISFGSCSFEEPIDDLREIGWIG
jgi:hypothetical protein